MLEAALRHDRAVVLGSLGIVVALAWLWLLFGADTAMPAMDMGDGQSMPTTSTWTASYAAVILLMWAIMMVAMMLPSAAPAILLVAALARRQATRAPLRAGGFTSGYLIVWFGFSLAATALQWGLNSAGLLSGSMATTSRLLIGTLLIAAGVYQWTPLKRACLAHCRSPIGFIVQHWRGDGWGPVHSGMRHGLFCLGCCWVLMLLLFVGGLMNLLWVAALALLVLVEKVLPWGGRISIVTGGGLVAWGAVVLARAMSAV